MAHLFSLWDDNICEIEIESDALTMAMPEPNDEVRQRLVLKRDGTVEFRRYVFGDGINQYIETDSRLYTVSTQKMMDLYDYIGYYLQMNSGKLLVTDVGYWNLVLTNSRGHRTPVSGPLFHNEKIICYREVPVCDIIRDILGIPDLLLFDGNMDRLDFIDIEYTKNVADYGDEDDEYDEDDEESGFAPNFGNHERENTPEALDLTYSRKERVQIDRAGKRIIYTTLDEKGCRYQQIWEDDKEILFFLNALGDECLLERQEPVDIIPEDNPVMTITYRLETRTKQGKTYMCEDRFDRHHVPEDWEIFVALFKSCFESHLRLGELFNEAYYGREVRLVSDDFFVIVQFSDYGRDYAYLCDDKSVKAGDWVLVPVGEYNTTKKVLVKRVEYHQPDKAPYPIGRIKKVIRKFNPATDVDPDLEATDIYRD